MAYKKEAVEHGMPAKPCSRKTTCAICTFFVILTALAIYVMIAYPQ
ncbi:MAG: hypothetical protein JO182_14490 [Acidobacteriaceae bacterium]|nr:hypothetical protein [Acidobacteriaceae bacterium]MBV9305994.1 hypothetical protein [Acidobacteriaceae bacterium]MBV9678162.1 hypothetical protein [Acidobacteriaceae bacterium]